MCSMFPLCVALFVCFHHAWPDVLRLKVTVLALNALGVLRVSYIASNGVYLSIYLTAKDIAVLLREKQGKNPCQAVTAEHWDRDVTALLDAHL
jgi:hypothetical protein